MRMLMTAHIPVEAGNAAAREGTMGSRLESIISELKPEAVYFTADEGERTCMMFLDISDPSQIPAIAEPFFLAFDARVDFTPAMTPADLQKAGPSIGAAVAKHG